MIQKALQNIRERLSTTDEAQLEQYVIRSAQAIEGTIAGSIDVAVTGEPWLTVGWMGYSTIRQIHSRYANPFLDMEPFSELNEHHDMAMEMVKSRATYLAGATIPFVIKYHQQILEYAHEFIKQNI